MQNRRLRQASLVLASLGLGIDHGHWLVPDRLLACGYPRSGRALQALRRQGIDVLINLHERPHEPLRLQAHDLTFVHIPIADFSAPTQSQIEQALTAIESALAQGKRIAVHCGAGLGRTGTLLACYLVSHGASATDAIETVRELRPGSIETREQAATVTAFAESRGAT